MTIGAGDHSRREDPGWGGSFLFTERTANANQKQTWHIQETHKRLLWPEQSGSGGQW